MRRRLRLTAALVASSAIAAPTAVAYMRWLGWWGLLAAAPTLVCICVACAEMGGE